MNNINHEKIKELGIFELRNLARSLGVKSPTVLKRDELLQEIKLVLSGQKPKYVRTTKQGRPPKSLSNSNELMSIIAPVEYDKENHEFVNQVFTFNDSGNEIENEDVGTSFKSIIKLSADSSYGFAFKNGFNETKDNIILLNKAQIEKYNLKDGDEICGNYILSNSNALIVCKIISLNGMVINQNLVRNNFDQMCATTSNKKLNLSIYKNDTEIYKEIDEFAPLAKGQRTLLVSDTENNLNNEILTRLSSSKKANILVLMIDECPEDYFELLSKNDLEILSNNYNSNNENFSLKMDCKIQNLIRQVENCNDHILFINDIVKLYLYLIKTNILLNQTKEQAEINAENYLKNLILLGKNCKETSLTVICSINETTINSFPETSKYVFKNLFNNIIVYKKVKKGYYLIKERCSTKNKEKLTK